jgi:hypothetical protein
MAQDAEAQDKGVVWQHTPGVAWTERFNVIEPLRRLVPENYEDPVEAQLIEQWAAQAQVEPEPLRVPKHLRHEPFVRVGDRFQTKEGGLALLVGRESLYTPSDSPEVARLAVDVLVVNRIEEVSLSGSPAFMQRLWIQASGAGMKVYGYAPSELDVSRAARRLARFGGDPKRVAELLRWTVTRPERHAPTVSLSDSPHKPYIEGVLIGHGEALHEFNPQGAASYFVQVITENDQPLTAWSPGLKDAVMSAKTSLTPGSVVGIASVAPHRQAVEDPEIVAEAEWQEQAELTNAPEPSVQHWIIEEVRFFRERREAAALFRQEATAKETALARYPELQGAYALLETTKRGMAERYLDWEQRTQVIKTLRNRIAMRFAYGESFGASGTQSAEPAREVIREPDLTR